MALLGVNIDHVATLRQARYRGSDVLGEPDPLRAAHEAELGGAEIITIHLREDRRHINDRDLARLREGVTARLNLEMGATDEMIGIALSTRPQMCTLVPEGRLEVTTEGGLDVAGQVPRLRATVERLKNAGMCVSAFIDANPRQVDAAMQAGFDACEVHTGPYAGAFATTGGDLKLGSLEAELRKLADAGHRIRAAGMRFHAGHALNYQNVRFVAGPEGLPGIAELHIGHALVSRAVFTGLRDAVREMKALMR
jgi:pyridoxine 5-phosphate synthase